MQRPSHGKGHHIYKSAPTGRSERHVPVADGGTSSAENAPKPNFFSLLMEHKLVLAIAGGAVVLLAIVAIVLAILLSGSGEPISSGVSEDNSLSASTSFFSTYDPTANSIPLELYDGIILPETEDAGLEYLEETLFLGDSNTARIHTFVNETQVPATRALGVESMGVDHVTTLQCVRFSGMGVVTMPQAVKLIQPRRVVINFGTNNAGLPVESFIESYKNAVTAVQTAYPHTEIIIASVFPITQTCHYGTLSMENIDAFNLALVELAKELELQYLNWSEVLRGANGFAQNKYMDSDGVHLSREGAKLVIQYLRTHASDAEDARPKPLQPSPACLGAITGLLRPESSSASTASSSSLYTSSSASTSSSVSAPSSSLVSSSSASASTAASSSSSATASSSAVSGSTAPSSAASVAPSAASSEAAPSAASTPPTQDVTINVVVTVTAGEGGTVTGGGTYPVTLPAGGNGSLTVNLVATPNAGYTFTGWSDGGAATHSVTIPVPASTASNTVIATYTATFTAEGGAA